MIPAERRAEELPRLRPLKIAPADLALRRPVFVGATGYVIHDTHRYSMSPEAIGFAGTLYLHRDRVRIVAGRLEAAHPRISTPNASSTLAEHRTERVAAVSGKRGKRYLERQRESYANSLITQNLPSEFQAAVESQCSEARIANVRDSSTRNTDD